MNRNVKKNKGENISENSKKKNYPNSISGQIDLLSLKVPGFKKLRHCFEKIVLLFWHLAQLEHEQMVAVVVVLSRA